MSITVGILTEIKNYLARKIPDFEVELMPNSPNDYFLSHPLGAVLISYVGSSFDNSRPTSLRVQTRNLQIALTVMTRDLHNEQGALELLDNLRSAILGFAPKNCEPCWILKEQYGGNDEDTGVWIYELIIATTTQQVEKKEARDLPRFVEALIKNKQQGE